MGARQNEMIDCPECGFPHYDSDQITINCIKCGATVKSQLELCRHPQRACMYGRCTVCGQKVD